MLKNYTRIEVNGFDDKCYYNDKGQLHCLDGPAVERKIGSKFWSINGKEHRNIDPADQFSDGEKRWYFKHKWHRIGGKAKLYEWYIHGKFYTKKEYYNIVWDI